MSDFTAKSEPNGDFSIVPDSTTHDAEVARAFKAYRDALGRTTPAKKSASDGATASYYELPEAARELQDLIAYRNMNAQLGEIFRACYRYGQCPHSPQKRDLKKIIFYAQAELARLERYEV